MRRLSRLLLIAGFVLLGSTPLASPAAAATLAATTTCSNGVDNTGGLGLICNVTVTNTITASGGTAVVTVEECHGPAGDPRAACTTTTTAVTELVTAVNQCNDSINGGGGTLRCTATIRNDFVGVATSPTAATVNQCVGSGGGITTGCDPFPATTSGAVITQCNNSANGGTLVGLTCTATGTSAAGAPVTINQCNDSANGGGALVICAASVTNNIVAASSPTPGPSTTSSGAPAPTVPPTDAAASAGSDSPSSLPLVMFSLFVTTAVAVGVLRRPRLA